MTGLRRRWNDYPFSAAISLVALSSSTLTSSLRLAGGSMRNAVVARQHVHVQMEDDLSAGGLVELLHGDAVGLERLHRGGRDLVGAARDMGVIVGRDVEDVAGRGLRDHQRMAGRARHDVEKGQHVLVLIDLVAGEFAAQDLCEDVVGVIGGHGGGSSVLSQFSGR